MTHRVFSHLKSWSTNQGSLYESSWQPIRSSELKIAERHPSVANISSHDSRRSWYRKVLRYYGRLKTLSWHCYRGSNSNESNPRIFNLLFGRNEQPSQHWQNQNNAAQQSYQPLAPYVQYQYSIWRKPKLVLTFPSSVSRGLSWTILISLLWGSGFRFPFPGTRFPVLIARFSLTTTRTQCTSETSVDQRTLGCQKEHTDVELVLSKFYLRLYTYLL